MGSGRHVAVHFTFQVRLMPRRTWARGGARGAFSSPRHCAGDVPASCARARCPPRLARRRYALGGGAELALAWDLRVCGQDVQVRQVVRARLPHTCEMLWGCNSWHATAAPGGNCLAPLQPPALPPPLPCPALPHTQFALPETRLGFIPGVLLPLRLSCSAVRAPAAGRRCLLSAPQAPTSPPRLAAPHAATAARSGRAASQGAATPAGGPLNTCCACCAVPAYMLR